MELIIFIIKLSSHLDSSLGVVIAFLFTMVNREVENTYNNLTKYCNDFSGQFY